MKNKAIKLLLLLTLIAVQSLQATAIYVVDTNKKELNNYFLGKWQVKTIVTQSNCPYIIVGSTTLSSVEIKKEDDKYKGYWSGGSWSGSEFQIDQLTETEALSKRITQNNLKDTTWKVVLTDHLLLGDDNKIRSEGIANQYKDGDFVGEYKTYSLLSKIE